MNWFAIKNHPWSKKVITLFRQGLAPREMALSIVIGSLIGILPLFGIAAFLIGILVVVLRLNLAITAFMAYAVTPLYLLLFVPFIRIGELIFGTEPTWLNFADIKASFQADYLVALQQLSFQLFCGVIGWFLVAVPVGILLYFALCQALAWTTKFRQD